MNTNSLYHSADAVRRALRMCAAISAMRDAFAQLAPGQVIPWYWF